MIDTREHPWRRAPEPGTYKVVPLRTAKLLKYCCRRCNTVSSLHTEQVRQGCVRNFKCSNPRCSFQGDLNLRGWRVVEFKKSDWPGGKGVPGTWRRDEKGKLWLCCPKCKKIGRLDEPDHQVDAKGDVTPSVGCPPTKMKPCDFHDMIRLLNYA